jgi:hypothetical protein
VGGVLAALAKRREAKKRRMEADEAKSGDGWLEVTVEGRRRWAEERERRAAIRLIGS